MHPYSVTFHPSDILIFKIISILLALFIVGTWLYNSNHLKLIKRIIVSIIAGLGSYCIVIFFFGILQFSYTTIKDNLDSNKQSATIVDYEKHISKSKIKSRGRSRSRPNVFYRPLLEYKNSSGTVKRNFGDISFSTKNRKAIGEVITIIVENKEVRMISPIKNFTFVVNIVMLCFLFLFYYIFYSYAKTQSFESAGSFALTIFGFIIFPIAFGILIYLFLNVGYEYFLLGKRNTSRNSAILFSGLGIFLLLCIFGYLRMLFEKFLFKKKKKPKKKKFKS